MDDDQIWAQLELKAKNVCETLEDQFDAGPVDARGMPLDIDDDGDEDEEHEASRAPKTPQQAKPKETLPSIVERLFSCLIDSMFCCGFTLPTKIQKDHYKINYVIWCACSLDRP